MTLQEHLAECYAERVLQDRAGRVNSFKTALGTDPDLKARAKAELARLRDIADRRCFLSIIQRRVIEDALS